MSPLVDLEKVSHYSLHLLFCWGRADQERQEEDPKDWLIGVVQVDRK